MRDNGLKRFNNRIAIFLLAIGLCMLAVPAIAEVPTAAFSGTPLTGTEPLTVSFTDSSTGDPTIWGWDFGDGGTSEEQNPNYTFDDPGTYTVSLVASNSDGNSSAETKTDYITVNIAAPVIDFSGSPTSGSPPPVSVSFTVTSTGGTPDIWSWDFGDGCSADTQTTSHTYNTSGEYDVSLTATNDGGTDTETKTDYINITHPVTAAPVASFTKSNTSGTAPLIVTFTSTSTNVDSSTEYLWDFGDGTTWPASTKTKIFSTVGTYTVRLNVSTANGESTTTQNVTVTAAASLPVASFYANKTSGYPPMTVKFYDTSSNSPTSWHWTFGTIGGTNTSLEQNPTFTYSESGYYNVTLKVFKSGVEGNDTEVKTNYIYVGTAATTATTATPTPTPTSTQVLPQMTAAFTEATTTATAVPTAAAPEGIFAEPYRINSVIEELVKLFKHMLGFG